MSDYTPGILFGKASEEGITSITNGVNTADGADTRGRMVTFKLDWPHMVNGFLFVRGWSWNMRGQFLHRGVVVKDFAFSSALGENKFIAVSPSLAVDEVRLNSTKDSLGGFHTFELYGDIIYNKKSLIRHLDRILSFSELGEWVDTSLSEPLSKQDFLTHGIEDLTVISEEKISELGDNFRILHWSDEPESSKIKCKVTFPLTRPYKILQSPELVAYTESGGPPTVYQTVQATSYLRFLVSVDGSTYFTFSEGGWLATRKEDILAVGMSRWEIGLISEAQWETLCPYFYKERLIILCGLYSQVAGKPLIKEMDITFKDMFALATGTISISTPSLGFRKSLDTVTQTYNLALETGIALDDAGTDYDLYTTPDKIKLRPLNFNTLVGGHESDVKAFEVISGYEGTDFNVELFITKDGRNAVQQGNYALLDDSIVPEFRTRIELSLSQEPFSPMYPVKFRLNKLSKRTVYIKIKPQVTTQGNEKFQVKLIARPI